MDVDCDQVSHRIGASNNISIVHIKASTLRKFNFNNKDEIMFRLIGSHFYNQEKTAEIESMDIVSNPSLEAMFESQQNNFKQRNIPDNPIIAYHGTPQANIMSILQNNLDKSKARRQYHGKGNYLSEYPSLAVPYSIDRKTLIVFKVFLKVGV